MTIVQQTLRYVAGTIAIAIGLILMLHVSIVLGYGGGDSVESVARIILGIAIVVILIAMWMLKKPFSVFARTGICLGLFALYAISDTVILGIAIVIVLIAMRVSPVIKFFGSGSGLTP